jgi:murein DD-endopeptidase MepM/ murein hydrolase activator NlpD
MKKAPRYPSRWAGRWRTLIITAALTGLGACSSMDNVFYGAREGTMEYPGSGAGPNAVPTYIVKNKDTVDGIAYRYGVSTQSIVDRNRLQPPYSLRAGQTLAVPGAKVVAPETDTATATQPSGPPGGPVKKETLPPPPGQQAEPAPQRPQPAAGEPTPLSPASATAPPPGPAPRFQWPLNGKVITPYGNAGGQKSDGIDIATANGTPVKAADGGKVVYAGDGVPHLGNLLLVEHSAGYITAYGNNESLLVKKDDVVKKGQTIARAGSSGGASSPRLHFEIRRGGSQTLDPMTMLPAQ